MYSVIIITQYNTIYQITYNRDSITIFKDYNFHFIIGILLPTSIHLR